MNISISIGPWSIQLPDEDDPKQTFRAIAAVAWNHLTAREYEEATQLARASDGNVDMLRPLADYLAGCPFPNSRSAA